MHEELIEEGIVLKSENGIAEIALLENDNCEECTAKIFCKPKESDDYKVLTVSNSLGAFPGDNVKISVEGKAVLKASILLYGLPLLLIISGILIGMNIFIKTAQPELYSFLTGIFFNVVYFTILLSFAKNKISINNIPKIVTIKKNK